MKVTFPYMGNITVYKKILELLGHDVILPPKPSQRTVDLGVKHSPEFLCFPFKVILGSYIEAIEGGADMVITSGGNGPCRAGFYGEIHRRMLAKMGYEGEFLIFDSIYENFGEFYNNLKKLLNHKSIFYFLSKFLFCYRMLTNMDQFEKRIKVLRAHEKHKGDCNAAWSQILELFDRSYTPKELNHAIRTSREILDSIAIQPYESNKALRVGLIGEIYVVMEDSVNMKIEEVLNGMGVEVESAQYISEWLQRALDLQLPFMPKSHGNKLIDRGRKYLYMNVGGHEIENIGSIMEYKEKGLDGVIHLMPFACLPELVTQSVIPSVSKDLDIPVLTLSLDEQMGTANNLTRVEAFVDLLKSRKAKAGAGKAPEKEPLPVG